MNDALMYFLKVNVAIALFYLFFRLAFYNDTFWKTRRFYLIFSILLSVVYPFISFTGWLEKQEPMQTIVLDYVQLQEVALTPQPTSILTVENILLAVYALVSAVLLVKMLVQLISILRWKWKGDKQLLQGIEIISVKENITPFSFFNMIFINPTLHNEHDTKQILTHELTHARQMHSVDVMVSELTTIVCWINPAAWLLKREIRHNLEFLADSKVVESGFDSKDYQYHLLELSYQTPEIKLGNKFNVAPLKKRITMMNQQKTNKAGILKYSLIVPLALALILSSNAQSIVNSTKKALSAAKSVVVNNKKETQKPVTVITPNEQPVKQELTAAIQNTNPTTQQSDDKKIYTVVESMPQFPGGEKALLKYISQHVQYPADAHKNGVQGSVVVRFTVNESGKVENAVIVRGLYPSIDAEGLKVVSSLPDFIPGEQNGKKVAVYYSLPLQFAIDGGIPSIAGTLNGAAFKSSVVTSQTIKYDGEAPLFVVDGKEVTESDFKAIKPENIQSINTLKKEEAIKVYGDKGKNSVVLITMKK
ncbi:TonB family protein [Paludibacter propionicigenes WB4]|uniref:TonB family protein n=1 Tax=Paludibacter propionicigenes (strain DSM 17365 / JCM 13257 / WB4) TaxID=694427 RepID=E4T8B3_PALPW|nr:M56 family metallopeptidase [Paludibacter propionicigenes]ADQ80957.1 TonB family protein [Paludibacter propionicigenes WB4]